MEDLNSPSPFLAKYLNAYEKDPNSRVFAPLAEAYRKSGYVEKALEILKDGIKSHPSYILGYLGLGNCYFDLGEFSQSYSVLRPLVESNRDNLILQKLFAQTCIKLNNKEEALETYKYLLFINPKDKDVAKNVKEIESELDGSQMDQSFDSRDVPEGGFFKESNLTPNPNDFGVDIDEWIQVDLSETSSSKEKKFNDEEWNMLNIQSDLASSASTSVGEQNLSEIVSDEADEKKKDDPVITHTLVDIYCSQGYIDKAVEILNKILELNPSCKSTKEKLKEIYLHYDLQEFESLSTEVKIEEKSEELIIPTYDFNNEIKGFSDEGFEGNVEIEAKNNYQEKAYKFLNRIKKRAQKNTV